MKQNDGLPSLTQLWRTLRDMEGNLQWNQLMRQYVPMWNMLSYLKQDSFSCCETQSQLPLY